MRAHIYAYPSFLKMLFRFENLSIKPGARDSWELERGTVREMWENYLERFKMPDEAAKMREVEHLLTFSTRSTSQPGRIVLGWDDTPAADDYFLWARFNLSRAKWSGDEQGEDKEKAKVD
jgi:hypothetical protein